MPRPATTTSSTRTTGSPARSAGSRPTAGASPSCTRCTRWRGSRTSTSPTATSPSRVGREIGEAQVVEAADRLVANTEREAGELVALYDADPDRVVVAEPGVDLSTFTPGSVAGARAAVGVPTDAVLLLFVGRIQPLKGPDVLVRAAGEILRRRPDLRSRLVVAVLGGASGTGVRNPMGLEDLAERRGIADLVRFVPPVDRPTLAQWYRAADVVAVPSHSESFGLVAVEAQACGTPVVAANVGGLPTAVGSAGVLVDGHDTADWATAIAGGRPRPRATGRALARLGRARVRLRLGAHRGAARRGLRRRDGPAAGGVDQRRRACSPASRRP